MITVNAPLHEGTRDLINAQTLKHVKKGAWLVNTARGAICNAEAVAAAVKSGQLNGYAGELPAKSIRAESGGLMQGVV